MSPLSPRTGCLVALLGPMPFVMVWAFTPWDVNLVHFIAGCVIMGQFWGQLVAAMVGGEA